jgi:eukaryotic-like serine/threonine-protein kinase
VSALRSSAALGAGLAAAGLAGAGVAAAADGGSTQALAATGAGSGAGGGSGPPTGSSYVPPETPPKRRSTTFLWVMIGVLVLLGAGLLFLATRLDRNSTAQKQVPDVTNKQVDVARAQLEAQGFKVQVTLVANTDHDNGQVISQDPVGGQLADQGSTIKLTVSKGAGQVKVPSVVGQAQVAATSQLDAEGFTVRAIPQSSPTVPTGQVISQSPAAGNLADHGSEVDISVSTGPATLKVPDVSGESVAAATANLTRDGFQVATTQQSSSTTPNGLVIGTNPAAGIEVAPGTKVTIIVSSGPPATSSTTSTTAPTPPPPTAAATPAN